MCQKCFSSEISKFTIGFRIENIVKISLKINDIFSYFSIGNCIVKFLISWDPSKIWKSPDVWQLFSSINTSKPFGFFPMIQKINVVVRNPLRTPPFIASPLLHTKMSLTWKILGFIAWRHHIDLFFFDSMKSNKKSGVFCYKPFGGVAPPYTVPRTPWLL